MDDCFSTREQTAEGIEIASVSLAMQAEIFSSGWQAALQRLPKTKAQTTNFQFPAAKTVSLVAKPPKIHVSSFVFPEAPAWGAETGNVNTNRAASSRLPAKKKPSQRTRIRPPGDVIKLQDRLYYLLQPALENLLQAASLTFPFEPFPYQYDGVAFLYSRYSAILADEMGLGKTMQAITTMRLLLRAGELRNILLVCPKPLVTNWQRELKLWAPEAPVAIIAGDQTQREWCWRQPQAPIKIVNYELLLRDRELIANGKLHFDLVVLDEAQRIKNRSSATSQVVRAIPRSRSWALTGTPVENSPEDLVGIFEFLSPSYLHSQMSAQRIGAAVGDYILRRTKDKVLTDLPPKLYRDANLDLTGEQAESYRVAEEEGVVRLNRLGDSAAIQHVFELVLRLKQICNFDPATGESAKMERLEADLEEVVASGRKAIVFSQWVKTLTTLRDKLQRFGPVEYHGGTPSSRRDAVIENFRNDPAKHVILMSYGAGSVGLNLQFCGYVFLFDRWWNPAVEDQAINRAHRIGVSGPVTVTRFLTRNTIEERIDQILREKRELFDIIFSQTSTPSRLGLSRQEIFGLFKLPPPAASRRESA